MDDVESSPPPKSASGPSPILMGQWLALVMVGAKAAMLGVPRSCEWLLVLTRVSAQDLIFALLFGAAGEIAVRSAERRPILARILRTLFLVLGVLCAISSIVAIGVFDYFDRPLTYDLLRLVRHVGAVRSSIGSQFTWPIAIALAVVPLGFYALVHRFHHSSIRLPWVFAAAVLWIGIGWSSFAERIPLRSEQLRLNPQTELIRSSVSALRGPRKVTFPADFPREDMEEFQPFARRNAKPAGFSFSPGIPRPRNVIVIILESVGTKYLSLYGSKYDTTPHLIEEAAHAAVFENIYAHAPYTYCSFTALNFSIYPGLPWRYAPWAGRPCPPPLASARNEQRWRTAYLHNGDLDWAAERWLLEQSASYETMRGFQEMGCTPLTSWGGEDRCLFDNLIHWIEKKPNEPFLAFCWTDQTHDPYHLAPGFVPIDFFHGNPPAQLAQDLSRYLNVIHETDRNLGRLFDLLRARGLADDTLVVITGDHGEAFRDPHGQRGHSFTIYEEDIHVPMIFWNPRLFPQGQRLATIGAHVDMNPTIADLLGIEPRPEWQGRSLFDPARPPRAFFLTNISDYLFGLREQNWKYIYDATGGREMLFDLANDAQEQHNTAASDPDRCRRMLQRIAAWVTFEEGFLQEKPDAKAAARAEFTPLSVRAAR
ncbi:MAG: hypothetical protein QOD99_444 [Chthoniobacter sp.]|jgi:arylsulfatase A-like enzyme|nr:hypothetical protein [Chthoniobacter sp.]